MYYSSKAIINLEVLHKNIEIIKRQAKGCNLMAVVKANGYGHGAVEIARQSLKAGVVMLGVANVLEALELREAGINEPMLILGVSSQEQTALAIQKDVSITLSSKLTLEWIIEAAQKANKKVNIHIKLDTGMGRIGFTNVNEFVDAYLEMQAEKYLNIEGIFTHMADGSHKKYTQCQLERFKNMLQLLKAKLNVVPKYVHAANTITTFSGYEIVGQNLVRVGIGLYGYEKKESVKALRPILSWETQIVHLKEVNAGTCLGYGMTYCAENAINVATIPVGYADGYPRLLSNKGKVIINGQKCSVVGRVCMDQILVDVSKLEFVQVGDKVTLIGVQDNEIITADDISQWAQTISYEILTSISKRVERIYVYE